MALFKTTWTHLRRSPYQALAAILVLILTFFLSAAFLLLAVGSTVLLSYFQSRPQVSAFFKDQVGEERIRQIESELLTTGLVSQVKFVSKEEALQIYREQNKDDPLLLELVTADILPASLEISSYNLANLGRLAEILAGKEEVEEVVFQKDVVERLAAVISSLRIGGGALVGFLIFVSLTIILMITGMRIAVRREEISITQLLGATPWFIRGPFILEGLTYGLVGSLVGTSIVYLIFFYFKPVLDQFLAGIPFFPLGWQILVIIFSAQVLVGAFLGSFGSLLAVWRYLR